jgi:hypothetical protein
LIDVRAKAARWALIARLVGPHPIELARAFLFLATRPLRSHRRGRVYSAPLPPAHVELHPPSIGLARFDDLPAALRTAATRLQEEAKHVLAHRVEFLGSGFVELGPDIDWHRDFKSGYRWPERYYQDIEVTRLADRSDAKVPWELSRCHHLLTLARAARLFEEERYVWEFEAQLASWLDANPPGIGINWTNPMEIGIRAVNLVWAVGTLEEWRPLTPTIRDRLVTSLRWHAHHIHDNLEGSPYLRSNHYLGDLLGLLVLGSVLKGEPSARKWSRFARRELQREVEKQVLPDGVGFEASLPYHGLAMEMFLVADGVSAQAGSPLSRTFHERLRRMAAVSRSVRHEDGRIPLFGDQDSGRVLPEGFARPPTQDNLLWLATTLDGKTKPFEGPPHPEVAWTFGLERWRRVGELPLGSPPGPAAFPDGGIFVLRTERSHVVVRCGDVGQNGFGGHAHNDLLSFELSLDDVPLIVDSGTYAYTFDVDARNEFRSTRAHNTVRIDDAEIHPIDPERVFELRRFARYKVEACELSRDPMVLTCSHDGYRRLEPPCLHRRHFSLVAGSGELSIRDELLGAGFHQVESFLHLPAGSSLERVGESTFDVTRRGRRARIAFSKIAAGELIVEESWVSENYGVRERAPVLVSRARRAFPASLGYTITPL